MGFIENNKAKIVNILLIFLKTVTSKNCSFGFVIILKFKTELPKNNIHFLKKKMLIFPQNY